MSKSLSTSLWQPFFGLNRYNPANEKSRRGRRACPGR